MDEYISREALLADLAADYGEWISRDDTDESYCQGVRDNFGDTIRLINKLPAADVQPVKHGRWIWVKNFRDCEGDIYSQYKCNCCNFVVSSVYSINDLTHFCGNCGAKMLK